MKTATSEITKPNQKRPVIIWVVFGILIGGLIGFFSYDALLNTEQDQAMNDYFLGIPGVVDNGFRLLRAGIGSACGATAGLVLGALLGQRRHRKLK